MDILLYIVTGIIASIWILTVLVALFVNNNNDNDNDNDKTT